MLCAWPPSTRTWGSLTRVTGPDQHGPPVYSQQMTNLPVFFQTLQPHSPCSLAFIHTTPWTLDPNKKAVVEKAVDGLKEKKNKVASPEVDEVKIVVW